MTIHKQIYRGWLEDMEGLEGGDQLYNTGKLTESGTLDLFPWIRQEVSLEPAAKLRGAE
jgi:hypothetical protein